MTADRRPETLAEARRADRVASRTRALQDARDRREQAEADLRATVAGLRRDGVSWGRIAAVLGVSPQAAQQRFDKKS